MKPVANFPVPKLHRIKTFGKTSMFGSMEVWFMERRIKTPENDKNHSPIRDCKDRATHTSMNN